MSDTRNRAVIGDYYRALGVGDFAHVVGLHSLDLVCWMSGSSLVSGRFSGREALYAHMGNHVLGPLVTGTEPYVKESLIAIVDGSMVVGILHGGLPAKDGGRYDQFYLQIFRLRNGLIVEIVEFFDTVMVENVLMKNHLETQRQMRARPFGIVITPGTSRHIRDEVVAVTVRLLESLQTQDPHQLGAVVHPLVCTRIIGSTPLSGTFNGIQALTAVFNRGVKEVRLICADSASACVLMRSSDPAYDQQYGILVGVAQQQVVDVSIFLDTVEVERVLYANPVLPKASLSVMPAFDITNAHLAALSR